MDQDECKRAIQHELLRDFFSSLVNAGKTGDSILNEPVWPTNSLRHQRRREIEAKMAGHRERLHLAQARREARAAT